MTDMLHSDTEFCLPMPIFLVVEDVGWWQGTDGSSQNEPFRNRLGRRHCLADYQALARLARQLSMRIALGMVIGEWDRTNCLRDIAGATWMGRSWDNTVNQGPWLDEAAQYLRDQSDWLEIALHGLCHEFWQYGQMQRAEFHDRDGHMRPLAIVRSHLEAFAAILKQNNLPDFPRLFIPPALHHSFGSGDGSMQALLHEFGIEYVTTRFSRAQQFSPPVHEKITWECGVTLLERGLTPVQWGEIAAKPAWHGANPILPLHWGNLLHLDPERNGAIVDAWARMLLARARGLDCILAEDLASCWCQAAVFYLAKVQAGGRGVLIDLRAIPDLPCFRGPFFLKIRDRQPRAWNCTGGTILSKKVEHDDIQTLKLLPEKGQGKVEIFPV